MTAGAEPLGNRRESSPSSSYCAGCSSLATASSATSRLLRRHSPAVSIAFVPDAESYSALQPAGDEFGCLRSHSRFNVNAVRRDVTATGAHRIRTIAQVDRFKAEYRAQRGQRAPARLEGLPKTATAATPRVAGPPPESADGTAGAISIAEVRAAAMPTESPAKLFLITHALLLCNG